MHYEFQDIAVQPAGVNVLFGFDARHIIGNGHTGREDMLDSDARRVERHYELFLLTRRDDILHEYVYIRRCRHATTSFIPRFHDTASKRRDACRYAGAMITASIESLKYYHAIANAGYCMR